MRERNRQMFRFFVVLGLGASLAGMAAQSAHQEKPIPRADKMRPEPIILATVIESTVPEPCLAPPRDAGGRAKKKIIACG